MNIQTKVSLGRFELWSISDLLFYISISALYDPVIVCRTFASNILLCIQHVSVHERDCELRTRVIYPVIKYETPGTIRRRRRIRDPNNFVEVIFIIYFFFSIPPLVSPSTGRAVFKSFDVSVLHNISNSAIGGGAVWSGRTVEAVCLPNLSYYTIQVSIPLSLSLSIFQNIMYKTVWLLRYIIILFFISISILRYLFSLSDHIRPDMNG